MDIWLDLGKEIKHFLVKLLVKLPQPKMFTVYNNLAWTEGENRNQIFFFYRVKKRKISNHKKNKTTKRENLSRFEKMSEFMEWAVIIIYTRSIVLMFVVIITTFEPWYHQIRVDPGNLHGISNWPIYLIYGGKLFSFHCTYLGLSRLVLIFSIASVVATF